MSQAAPAEAPSREVPVWDPFVRLSHWLVAAGFTVAYLTEGEPLQPHVLAGYLIAILVALRVVWGFVGPRHARFSDFVRGPGEVLNYLRDLVAFRARRHLGHSPAGGAMTVALLLFLAATTATGMALLAETKGEGPLAGVVAQRPATKAGGDAYRAAESHGEADDDDDDDDDERDARGEESVFEEAHELLANLTLALALIHLGGVALAGAVHGENLARAMVTGRKRPLSTTGD